MGGRRHRAAEQSRRPHLRRPDRGPSSPRESPIRRRGEPNEPGSSPSRLERAPRSRASILTDPRPARSDREHRNNLARVLRLEGRRGGPREVP